MSWESPLYLPPANLVEDVPPQLDGKPMATIHEIIRQTLRNYQYDDVSTTWVLNRVQKIMLNTPNFRRLRGTILQSGSGFSSLQGEVKRLIYSNLCLPKVPNRRKVLKGEYLLRISDGCEWYVCADRRTFEELEAEYGRVEVLERGRIDIRLVLRPESSPSGARWHDDLDQSRETPDPTGFLISVWDENQGNEESHVPSDRLRHYRPVRQLDAVGMDNKARRSFETSAPLDGWQTSNAMLAYDDGSEYAYGLSFDPSQNYKWATEGWSISRWEIGNGWPDNPTIRHIGSVNGVQVSDLGPIFDLMRAIRCNASKVDIKEALQSNDIGWDLPYSPYSPTTHHSYWLNVARALYTSGLVDQIHAISLAEELFRRSGWETIT